MNKTDCNNGRNNYGNTDGNAGSYLLLPKLYLAGAALAVLMSSCSVKMVPSMTPEMSIQTEASRKKMELLVKKSEESLDSIVNASLLSTLSKYRPKISEMPDDLTIINGDSLNLNGYTYGYGILDSAAIAHNALVIKNALRIIPKSKPYISTVIDACDRYKGIFPVPPETILALLWAESNFVAIS